MNLNKAVVIKHDGRLRDCHPQIAQDYYGFTDKEIKEAQDYGYILEIDNNFN